MSTSTTTDWAAARAKAVSLAGGGLRLLVGNSLLESAEGALLDVVDPSTGEIVTSVPRATAADVDAAARAGRAALDAGWSILDAKARESALRRLAVLVDAHREELALLESIDTGKPLEMSRTVDVPLAIDALEYYAGWPTKLYGHTIPAGGPGRLVYTRLEPVGVAGQITPWNFPLFDAAGRIGMAVAAGCPIVLKPAESTPLSALYLAQLVAEADLPPGTVSILPGYGFDAGQALVEHPMIDVIGFTGSTAVGRRLAAKGGELLKPVSLELGGKSPNVIFDDCDLWPAIDAAVSGIFLNSGQVCSAGSRLLVQEGIYDDVVAEVARRAAAMQVGGAFTEGSQMGPVVSEGQFSKICEFLRVAAADGSVVTGGARDESAEGGFFIEPTVVADLAPESRVVTEEIFGPVLAVERFTSFDEAVTLANKGSYGLAASVWSQDGAKATRFAHAVAAGTVWVNCFHQYDIAVPWGGVKSSGFGRARGKESLLHLTTPKVVWNAL